MNCRRVTITTAKAPSLYIPFEGEPIELNAGQRNELSEIARSQSLPAGFVLRAKILLLLADGSPTTPSRRS